MPSQTTPSTSFDVRIASLGTCALASVAAYTEQFALALAARGWPVHVWWPNHSENGSECSAANAIQVHRLDGGFSPAGLAACQGTINRGGRSTSGAHPGVAEGQVTKSN